MTFVSSSHSSFSSARLAAFDRRCRFTTTDPLTRLTLYNRHNPESPLYFSICDQSSEQPGVQDPEVERLVSDRLELFWDALDRSPGLGAAGKRGQIGVTFFERRQKKTWFSTGEVHTSRSSASLYHSLTKHLSHHFCRKKSHGRYGASVRTSRSSAPSDSSWYRTINADIYSGTTERGEPHLLRGHYSMISGRLTLDRTNRSAEYPERTA